MKRIDAMHISHVDNMLYTASQDGTVRSWDVDVWSIFYFTNCSSLEKWSNCTIVENMSIPYMPTIKHCYAHNINNCFVLIWR